jgi:hypothetical protein
MKKARPRDLVAFGADTRNYARDLAAGSATANAKDHFSQAFHALIVAPQRDQPSSQRIEG